MIDGSVPLFEASLFAVTGTVPADRSTSWIAPHLVGQLAVPCYVLASEGSALIIDTGLAAHWELIRHGLDLLLANSPRRALIMTRREPDAISNLPAIVARYRLQTVYCGGVISPLDFFERVETISTSMHIRSIAATDVEWLPPGTVLTVGRHCLEVLPTAIRVLPKNHLYDRQSRTLFASDTWGLLPQPTTGPPGVVRIDDERLSVASLVGYLRHRFEWLAGIDTTPMQDELAQLIASRPIDRICPSYGCVIEGAELVSTVVHRTIRALEVLSRQARARRLESLDRARMAVAIGATSSF